MIKNYLKIAWRSLLKNPLFSFINVFGLTVSIVVCMMVMVHVKEELSYDGFHPHPERTYRILSEVSENRNARHYTLASTPLALQSELIAQKDIVEGTVQLYPALKGKAVSDDKELSVNGVFTDPSFFKVFGFKLAAGDPKTALALTDGIVLSNETALKFFGNTNAIGKTVQFDKLGTYQVTGVLEKTDHRSHIEYDAYASSLSVAQLEKLKALPEVWNKWNSLHNGYTYVLLRKGISRDYFQTILKQISATPQLTSKEGEIKFREQPLSKITPGSDDIHNEIGKGTVWAKLLTVIGVGLIILAAACFNYTNLTIARALSRAKEVGIRKVSGASRAQIFFQYIIESVLVALLALFLAYLAFKQYKPVESSDFTLILYFSIFAILTGSLAGAFPAWILSSFKPVNVLKNISTRKFLGNLSIQNGLMIFQFSLSLVIVIFLTAYYRQFTYIKSLDPGFYSKNILSIPYSSKDQVFAEEVSGISGVERTFRISENFGMRGSGSIPVFHDKPTGQQGMSCDFYFTDAATLPASRLTLIAGDNFTAEEEIEKERSVLLNEKAVEVVGFKNAVTAVGKMLWLNDSTQVQVAGVVKDFYHLGAARRISPVIFRNRLDGFNYLNVEVNSMTKESVVKQIAAIWHKLKPHAPFAYEWLDKKIANREDQGEAYATIGFLAFITISIASLGLLGLVVYAVETRQKEISIRKVIGATVNQLMFLLSRGFLKLLLISGLIAMPIGYILSFFFLQNFANRVSFGVGSLLLSFLLLLAIGLFTILSQTYKAATANPSKNLRND